METKIRVGILGMGNRGASLVKPLLDNGPDVEITTVIDPDVSQARFFMRNHGLLPEGDSGAQIAENEINRIRFVKDISELRPGELDILLLTASERVRTEVFRQALATGAHVFMEKGLSNSIEGCRKIVEAMKIKKARQQIFMGFNLRFHPLCIEAEKIIRRGDIGKVLFVHYIEKLREVHGASFFRRFHRDINESGGMLVTKACHDLDLVNFLIKMKPERVFASCRRAVFGRGGELASENCRTCSRADSCEYHWLKHVGNTRKAISYHNEVYMGNNPVNSLGYVPDSCVFRKTELTDLNNLLVEYEGGATLSYSQVLFSTDQGREISIFGTEGSITFYLNQKILKIRSKWNKSEYDFSSKEYEGNHGGADVKMVTELLNIIRENKNTPTQIEDGVTALATAFAAYRSSEDKRWVDIDEIMKEIYKQ